MQGLRALLRQRGQRGARAQRRGARVGVDLVGEGLIVEVAAQIDVGHGEAREERSQRERRLAPRLPRRGGRRVVREGLRERLRGRLVGPERVVVDELGEEIGERPRGALRVGEDERETGRLERLPRGAGGGVRGRIQGQLGVARDRRERRERVAHRVREEAGAPGEQGVTPRDGVRVEPPEHLDVVHGVVVPDPHAGGVPPRELPEGRGVVEQDRLREYTLSCPGQRDVRGELGERAEVRRVAAREVLGEPRVDARDEPQPRRRIARLHRREERLRERGVGLSERRRVLRGDVVEEQRGVPDPGVVCHRGDLGEERLHVGLLRGIDVFPRRDRPHDVHPDAAPEVREVLEMAHRGRVVGLAPRVSVLRVLLGRVDVRIQSERPHPEDHLLPLVPCPRPAVKALDHSVHRPCRRPGKGLSLARDCHADRRLGRAYPVDEVAVRRGAGIEAHARVGDCRPLGATLREAQGAAARERARRLDAEEPFPIHFEVDPVAVARPLHGAERASRGAPRDRDPGHLRARRQAEAQHAQRRGALESDSHARPVHGALHGRVVERAAIEACRHSDRRFRRHDVDAELADGEGRLIAEAGPVEREIACRALLAGHLPRRFRIVVAHGPGPDSQLREAERAVPEGRRVERCEGGQIQRSRPRIGARGARGEEQRGDGDRGVGGAHRAMVRARSRGG